ncbi:hypothetical protein [Actinoplanes sp. NPDC049265]|uniref:WXG100-like domain-containing protein n=1 Tax=Actinoplanes sp. NPDC049265 TaxID=3363902 RepID=UPI00371BE0C5
MAIAEPVDSRLWQAVQGRVRWPTANEDVTAVLAHDWADAVASFRYAASSTKDLPDTAWPDSVGRVFDAKIGELRQRVEQDSDGMARLARITRAYGEDVGYAKGEIVRVLPSWDAVFRSEPEVADGFATLINDFLQAMATRIKARGDAGPEATDLARTGLPTPDDVLAQAAAAPPPGGFNPPPQPIERISQQQQGHIRGTPQYELRIQQGKPTSYFETEREANLYTYEAWYKGTPVNGNPNIRELDFGHKVGSGYYGGYQTRVTAVMDSQGHVHGYPSGPELHF